jgi:hypothetical protein
MRKLKRRYFHCLRSRLIFHAIVRAFSKQCAAGEFNWALLHQRLVDGRQA